MKWVRQRCQAAPGSVAAIASTRPGCASELTSLTPARPRATRPRTKASQAAPSSAVTTSRPSDSRKPSALTPTAWTTQTLTVRPPSRHFTTSASRVTYAYGRAVERAGAEVLDDLIEALRQPRDLALRHPLDAELLHELLDTAGGDAGEVGVGDHRHERLLGPPPRLQQPVGEVRALAQLGHRELDRTDAACPSRAPGSRYAG